MNNVKLSIRIGLVTGGVIILFQLISLLVIYRYIKLDFYLCAVALAFLSLGWHLSRREPRTAPPSSDWRLLISSKEMQILKLLSEGRTNKEIATLQFIELSTVKTHINRIYSKLSVSNRKEARVKYAEMAQKQGDL